MTLTTVDKKYLAAVGRAGDAGTTLSDVAREFSVAVPMVNIYLSVLVVTKHINLFRGRYYITPKGATALGRAPEQRELAI